MQIKNKWRVTFILMVLLLGLVSVSSLYFWLFYPPVHVVDMSLPKEFFPTGADYHPMHSARDSLPAIDSGIQTIYWSGLAGLATFNVERLPTYAWARKAYGFYESLDNYFLYTERLYQSQIADDFSTGCGFSEFGGFRCGYTARYREYVATLNVVIDENLTMEDFVEIVEHIDQSFQESLYGPD
jgi:hypothetical protein